LWISPKISPSALPAAFRRGDGRGEQCPDRGHQVADEFLSRELRQCAGAGDVVYLPESSPGHPLLVLGIWLAGSLAVLACVDLLHLAERRGAPEREAEIYATPGTAHLRQRRARRRAAALKTAGPAGFQNAA
jgi:hypothetical protein